MAFLGKTYNTNEIPAESYDLVPAGWYQAKITEGDVKETKAGTGKYVSLRFDIIGPSHQGRVVFGQFNVENPNAQAQEIGLKQFGAIIRATGQAVVSDTDQLLGHVIQIKVGVQKSKDEQYEDKNDVRGAKPSDAVVMLSNEDTPPSFARPSAPKTTSAPAPVGAGATTAAPRGATPPWLKK